MKALVLAVAAVLALALAGAGPASPGAPAPNVVVAGAVLSQGFGCVALELEPVAEACPGGHFHSGVDLAAAEGTQVHALAAGTVSVLEDPAGYGTFIRITHPGPYSTVYAHLSLTLARAGASAAAGEVIGLVGSTGLSTGPHLHFEVRRNGTPIDPGPFLKGGTQLW